MKTLRKPASSGKNHHAVYAYESQPDTLYAGSNNPCHSCHPDPHNHNFIELDARMKTGGSIGIASATADNSNPNKTVYSISGGEGAILDLSATVWWNPGPPVIYDEPPSPTPSSPLDFVSAQQDNTRVGK